MFDEFFSCPVKVGDRFYRKNYCNQQGLVIPDRIKVVDIKRVEDEDGSFFAITGHFIYHSVETQDKVYSSRIFSSGDWAIERKGIDFQGL